VFQAARFKDRVEAGQALAERLMQFSARKDVVILALPRGGVPVAYEVAKALHAPLDICVVRKLGLPGAEELAMGAIASGGVRVINDDVMTYVRVPDDIIEEITLREKKELERREQLYRGTREPAYLDGKTVFLIDDGLATGSTMQAAAAAVRAQNPYKIIVAVPVAPSEACLELSRHVDQVVCLMTPEPFYAVGLWYDDFPQTSDEEVRELLDRAYRETVSRGVEEGYAGSEFDEQPSAGWS